jgi:hypothetical protein
MKLLSLTLAIALSTGAAFANPVSLFDGKSFEGWEGETQKTWRIENGALVGGSLEAQVPQNEFLATKRSFANFDLRLKCKLVGTEGFVNAGIQLRSKRIPNHHEMIGYQADMGEGYWGSLYDESRRNKMLATADKELMQKTVKAGEWVEYRMRCDGRRIQLWINGVQTVDFTETTRDRANRANRRADPRRRQSGSALQRHHDRRAPVSVAAACSRPQSQPTCS